MTSSSTPPTVGVSEDAANAKLKTRIQDWNAKWTDTITSLQEQLAELGCEVQLRMVFRPDKVTKVSIFTRAHLEVVLPPITLR